MGKENDNKHKKYVVMEGLKHGNRFYTTNMPEETEEEKCKLITGEIVYKILGYADTGDEAREIISEGGYDSYTQHALQMARDILGMEDGLKASEA